MRALTAKQSLASGIRLTDALTRQPGVLLTDNVSMTIKLTGILNGHRRSCQPDCELNRLVQCDALSPGPRRPRPLMFVSAPSFQSWFRQCSSLPRQKQVTDGNRSVALMCITNQPHLARRKGQLMDVQTQRAAAAIYNQRRKIDTRCAA